MAASTSRRKFSSQFKAEAVQLVIQSQRPIICGAAPIPASSGKTNRHRLNRGGGRQANWALHQIALVSLSGDPRTKAYAAKLRAKGKSTT